MSVDAMSVGAGVSAWTVFWVQLPVLVFALAVIIVAITALRRARPEDVPRVFEAFATAFGRRIGLSRTARQRKQGTAQVDTRTEEGR
ncbi:hypothetical protein AB0M34_35275 [Nocardia sp. NPDC050193]